MTNINTIVVIDTETTGMAPAEGAALLEVAWIAISQNDEKWEYQSHEQNMIIFGGEIPPEARAVHHIHPDQCTADAGAWDRDDVVHSILAAEEDTICYAAHNADFDKQFLSELNLPWIDTLQCARHIWPEAPRHGNQVLRYYLKAEPDPELTQGLEAHRALYDTACTVEILKLMLDVHTPETLIKMSQEPAILHRCTFGKHAGQLWSEVPYDYLSWMVNKSGMSSSKDMRDRNQVHTARHYMGR